MLSPLSHKSDLKSNKPNNSPKGINPNLKNSNYSLNLENE